MIAFGSQNVWICQMGRKAEDGSFTDFVQAVSAAPLSIQGLNVDYAVPSLGKIKFGWSGPLTLDGKEIPLRGYPRWDNPYLHADFNTQQFDIQYNGKRLFLDFLKNQRNTQ